MKAKQEGFQEKKCHKSQCKTINLHIVLIPYSMHVSIFYYTAVKSLLLEWIIIFNYKCGGFHISEKMMQHKVIHDPAGMFLKNFSRDISMKNFNVFIYFLVFVLYQIFICIIQ